MKINFLPPQEPASELIDGITIPSAEYEEKLDLCKVDIEPSYKLYDDLKSALKNQFPMLIFDSISIVGWCSSVAPVAKTMKRATNKSKKSRKH